MIEEQIDPRPRHERDEPREQFRRREHEMRRPVGPRPLQRHGDAPVAQPLQALLPERRATEVAGRAARAAADRRRRRARPRGGRSRPSCAWSGTWRSTHGASGSAPTRRGPRPARRPRAARPSTAAWARPASATDSSASGSTASSLPVTPTSPRRSSRRRTRPTTRRTSSSVGGAAGWKPSVPSGSRTNTPSSTSVWKCTWRFTAPPKRCTLVTMPVSPPARPWRRAWRRYARAERPDEDAEHRAAQPMIVGEPVAQPVRDREHPLAHGHVGRQHVIHEVSRTLGHPPPAAARAEAAPLARERHEPLEGAVGTAHAGEAVRQHPAAEELPELGDDERRQPDSVGPGLDGGEERRRGACARPPEHARRRRPRHVDAGHAVRP